MDKCKQAYNEICNDLFSKQIPFNASFNKGVYITTSKGTITIKRTGTCILKANDRVIAKQILDRNKLSNTRKIWSGAIVSEYPRIGAKTIANDIQQLP